MNKNYFLQLVIFIVVLLALNVFFELHISILGSLALTIGLSFLFSMFNRR